MESSFGARTILIVSRAAILCQKLLLSKSVGLTHSLPVIYSNPSTAWLFGGENVTLRGFGPGPHFSGNGQPVATVVPVPLKVDSIDARPTLV